MLNDHIQHAPVGYKISTLGYKGKYIRNFTKSQHENMNKSLNKQNTTPTWLPLLTRPPPQKRITENKMLSINQGKLPKK